jgi:hypothetical protein
VSVRVEDVPAWWVERGIGHAVGWTEGPGGFTMTGCRMLVTGATPTCGRPARICRACRAALARATLRTESTETRPAGRG